MPAVRCERKRQQITAVVRAVAVVIAKSGMERGRLLDLCGGCGHVGLVLAALFPEWEVCVVDAKAFSLRVAEARAVEAGLRNLTVAEMDVQDVSDFDVAVALHACGEASDVVLERVMETRAGAVVVPCCVGGVVSGKPRGVPGIAETGVGGGRWGRARSAAVEEEIGVEGYRLLARAADDGEGSEAWRRAAKTVFEGDRMAWVEKNENFVRLVKMEPVECSPKNDMLVVWPRSWGGDNENDWAPDVRANAVVEEVVRKEGALRDFEASHVADVIRLLREEVCSAGSDGEHVFPFGQGSRGRKLVHGVAGHLDLFHSSIGKGAKRQVVVRRSPDWPFFFESYLGYGGPWVSSIARLLADVPESHAKKRVKAREGKAHHVTLVSAKEVKLLPSRFKFKPGTELVSYTRRALSRSAPKLVGLGRVADPEDAENDAWFAVLDWPAAEELRAELGLPRRDLHITLGFAKKDVHGVKKDASTLVGVY